MPGYIKIGRTETSVSQRMSELDKTSMPLPFQCYFAARVEDYARVEKTLHTAFGDQRVRQSREFFKMDPYKAKVVRTAFKSKMPNLFKFHRIVNSKNPNYK